MPPRPAPPTVADVARAAGVSTATVSRALNLPQQVRPALQARVAQAIERLGYVPHAGARALSLNRSGTFGIVIPTIDNAIFAHGLQAFQRRIGVHGYQLLLAFSGYRVDEELAQALNLMQRGVEAIALVGTSQRPELLERLARRGLPWAHTGSFPAPAGGACFGFRNRRAVGGAVRHLLELGHRRIAMLSGVVDGNDRARDRVRGVSQALARAGAPLRPEGFAEAVYEIGPARDAASRLLAASPAPSAIICGNDVLAWGAMLEAAARGLSIPADLSIVGFDDLPLSRHWQPPLTTVQVPIARMWELAADHLVERVRDPAIGPVQVEIPVELVVRGSTGPAPAAPRRRPLRRAAPTVGATPSATAAPPA
ncbi:MAG: LacI family DNA-binding transcriptional regulator [Lautropia sp.]